MKKNTFNTCFLTRVTLIALLAIAFSTAASAQTFPGQVPIDTTAYSVDKVQLLPGFPGGQQAWMRFMQNYRYPAEAVKAKASGRALIAFVVEKDGSLSSFKIVEDPGYGMAQEALRLMQTSPHWKPGINNGRPVRVAFVQPFSLAIQ